MPLLNYTTKVGPERTIAEIQKLLVEGAATSIRTDYEDGRPAAVTFTIDTAFGRRTFRLPVAAERVQAVLLRQRVEPRFSTLEHAERVAWRIVKDWLEAQVAIIETEMVTLDQVMLPYMHDALAGRTFYEAYRDQQLALPAGDE